MPKLQAGMPELPDIEAYCAGLEAHIGRAPLVRIRVYVPYLVRSVSPGLDAFEGLAVERFFRLGKRIVMAFPGDLFLVTHLMISGRLRWLPGERLTAKRPNGKNGLAAWEFENGLLVLVEAATKRRAGVWAISGEKDLEAHDPGGLEPLACSVEQFAERLRAENRTLKRALTTPRLFSGIGNAFSDEILWESRLSPMKLTSKLTDEEVERLQEAAVSVLGEWRERLCAQAVERFPPPNTVTAFRKEFAAHGKYGEPCPHCDKPIQRIRYANNECNYCAACQNEGRLLADRALSRLLKQDWPKTLEELEDLRAPQ